MSKEFEQAVEKIGRDIGSPDTYQRIADRNLTASVSPEETSPVPKIKGHRGKGSEGLIKIREMQRGDGDVSDDSGFDENIDFAAGLQLQNQSKT
jgi:hypothetical protein